MPPGISELGACGSREWVATIFAAIGIGNITRRQLQHMQPSQGYRLCCRRTRLGRDPAIA